MELNDLMSFDHVIRVHEDGAITEPTGIYAPEVYDEGGPSPVVSGDGWSLLNGYSGQYGYAGPVMHASEYIGGGLERDIRETPGYYVAVVVESLDDEPAGWAVAYREAVTPLSADEFAK